MTDNGNLFTGQQHTASVTAYRADGWKVFFSFVLDGNDPVASANTRIAELAANGYSATAPGAPEGCKLEMIGWVVRRRQINKDGRPDTPILDLYLDHEAWNGRLVGIYLNTPEEVAAFEKASGRKLESFPLFDGDVPAKRDNPRTSQYVIRLTAPIGAYIGDNPQYEGENDKTHQKRKFFGWKDAPLTAPTADAPAPAANVTPFPTPTNASDFDAAFPPNTTPAPHWTAEKTAQDKFFGWANKTYALGIAAVLEALGVNTITEYTRSKEDALKTIKAWIDAHQKASGQ